MCAKPPAKRSPPVNSARSPRPGLSPALVACRLASRTRRGQDTVCRCDASLPALSADLVAITGLTLSSGPLPGTAATLGTQIRDRAASVQGPTLLTARAQSVPFPPPAARNKSNDEGPTPEVDRPMGVSAQPIAFQQTDAYTNGQASCQIPLPYMSYLSAT